MKAGRRLSCLRPAGGRLWAVTDAAPSLASIPSPTTFAWFIGPIPIRAYAICIILGIVAACVITEIRLRRRGAPKFFVLDLVIWAVLFGIPGGRIYHVITSPENYFGPNGHVIDALKVYDGGLGIWGAVALGGVGVWIACRRAGVPLTFVADAVAPGLPVAQAIGRFGNWFNNELYGGPTSLPWGLTVYQQHDLASGHVDLDQNGNPIPVPEGTVHPTFLYEATWDVLIAVLVWQVDKRFKLGKGRAFALYVMAYTVGRFWIEAMRTDPANHFLGLRINDWVSIVVFVGALIYFLRVKGPQEHVRVDAGGRMHLVTAEGEPIHWRGERPELPAPPSSTGSAGSSPGGGDADKVPAASASSAPPDKDGEES
jgi:prolipoprotein diacylglyceryl transferase